MVRVALETDVNWLEANAGDWNALARGVPFRRSEWLATWWRHYGLPGSIADKRSALFLLTARDAQEQLVGIAPLYRIRRGRTLVLRFLGDGEVCSDYLSILCRAEHQDDVVCALADWLTDAARQQSCRQEHRWDRIELTGVDASDTAVCRLLVELEERGNTVHYASAVSSWRISLPQTWDQYLMTLSKPHRRRLRQADRAYFQSNRVQLQQACTPAEVDRVFPALVDLHQRRWQARGMPGAFASPPFIAFHREVSQRLAATGDVLISYLEMDGSPLAAEYHVLGDLITYAYQSGIDPDRLADEPGKLATLAALRYAIEHGQVGYDFLRGDEPYKAHLRAEQRRMLSVRVVPSGAKAQLQHTAWLAGQNVKHWIKTGLKLAGDLSPWPTSATR